MLAACLAWTQCAAALPQTPNPTHAEEVRAAVKKLGVNKRAGITLATGEKLHGRIAGMGEESFTLDLDHTRTVRDIPYDQVAQIHPGPSALIWVAIGVAAAAIVIIVVALARTPTVHSPAM